MSWLKFILNETNTQHAQRDWKFPQPLLKREKQNWANCRHPWQMNVLYHSSQSACSVNNVTVHFSIFSIQLFKRSFKIDPGFSWQQYFGSNQI